MKEFVDIANGDKLGVEYTPDEHETALAAVALYRKQLLAGNVTEDNETIEDGLDVCDRVEAALTDGNEIIDARVAEVLRTLYLPLMARMHEGVPLVRYASAAEALGMKAYDLFRHGMTARRMIDSADVELTPIIYDIDD